MANPSKTAFMLIRPSGDKKRKKFQVNLDKNTIIEETPVERMLGVQVDNELNWKHHLEHVHKNLNKGIYNLRKLQHLLGKKHLAQIAQGIFMSQLRYCAPVYLADKVKITSEDPQNQELQELQLKQNQMLRIIHKVKLKDKVGIQKMLDWSGMLSVNQTAAQSVLMETWKARNNEIIGIKKHMKPFESARNRYLFRTDKDQKSFISKAAKLWEKTTEKIKNTNNIKLAKAEILKLVKILPI